MNVLIARSLSAVASLSLLVGCGGGLHEGHGPAPELDAEGLAAVEEALSNGAVTGPFTIYPDPYLNGTPNPAEGMQGIVYFAKCDGGTAIVLRVKNGPPNRMFGSHVHVSACDVNQAGGHYQNVVPSDPALVSDPAYANPQNEVWLDLKTNSYGRGSASAYVKWHFRPDGANAVMIHDRHTDVNGKAGAKLACLNVNF